MMARFSTPLLFRCWMSDSAWPQYCDQLILLYYCLVSVYCRFISNYVIANFCLLLRLLMLLYHLHCAEYYDGCVFNELNNGSHLPLILFPWEPFTWLLCTLVVWDSLFWMSAFAVVSFWPVGIQWDRMLKSKKSRCKR